MSRPPGAGRALPVDRGPLPAGHTPVIHHLSDVAGPPAAPSRAYGVPMAGPTTRSAPGGLNSGPNQPAQKVQAPRQGGGGGGLKRG